MPLQVAYLHGFASSADSSKARFFRERLASRGIPLRCPDLNEPEFSTMTISRMIGQVERCVADVPPADLWIIGSSMGGFVAWHLAARAEARGAPLRGLVLLAPALDFAEDPMGDLGPDAIARWRDTGWRDFFHYAYGEPRALHYAFRQEAASYDAASVTVGSPVLVFHGRRDSVVSPAAIRRFAARRPNIRLQMLDDDHQLHASLEQIWSETIALLDARGARSA